MYVVRYEAAHVEDHSRLSTFFRWLLAIPAAIVPILYAIAIWFTSIATWVALVATGRYPEGLYRFHASALRSLNRYSGYAMLITDRYPPFDGAEHPDYPVRLHVEPPQAEYDRMKAALRLILAIPVYVIAYVLNIVGTVGAFVAWIVVVVSGRLPVGLQQIIELGLRYQIKAYAYYLMMSDDWPPFDDGPALAAGDVEPAPLPGGFVPPTA